MTPAIPPAYERGQQDGWEGKPMRQGLGELYAAGFKVGAEWRTRRTSIDQGRPALEKAKSDARSTYDEAHEIRTRAARMERPTRKPTKPTPNHPWQPKPDTDPSAQRAAFDAQRTHRRAERNRTACARASDRGSQAAATGATHDDCPYRDDRGGFRKAWLAGFGTHASKPSVVGS